MLYHSSFVIKCFIILQLLPHEFDLMVILILFSSKSLFQSHDCDLIQ